MFRILMSSLLVVGLGFSIMGCEDRRTTTYEEDRAVEPPPPQRQTEEPMYDTAPPAYDTAPPPQTPPANDTGVTAPDRGADFN